MMTTSHPASPVFSRRSVFALAGGAAGSWTVLTGGAAHAKPPWAGPHSLADVQLGLTADTQAARDALIPGDYIPGTGTTGPLPGTTFTEYWPQAGSTTISLDDAGLTYDGIEFWGTVEPRAEGITFRNCIFRGTDPLLFEALTGDARPGATAVVKAYDSRHFTLENCLIDPDAWVTSGRSSWRLANVTGIHGGNYTARWCDIRNTVDGVGIQAHNSPDIPAVDKTTTLDRCWIHAGNYVNDFPDGGHDDHTTHSDSVQFFSGKNITIRGCMVGGVRTGTGYVRWGRNAPDTPGTMLGGSPLFTYHGRNDGDDHATSAMMIKQEVSGRPDLDPKIEHVLIERNFISGGNAAVNISTASQPYGQDWSTLTIRDNRFFQRGGDWGKHTRVDPDTGAVTLEDSGADAYALRDAVRCRADFSAATNTVYDYVNNVDGGPITILEGD